jgi:hypothetical protein
MTKEELYAEYCIEYPMVQGYREVTYECWLEKQVIDSRAEAVNENAVLPLVMPSAIEQFNCRFHHIQEMVANKGITLSV